jgi:hypothetical protein
LINDYAPDLLEGTVPPDLCVEGAYTDGAYWDGIGFSNYTDDSYSADVDVDFQFVPPAPGESVAVFAYDHDMAFNDDVGGFSIDINGLRELAGCGPYAWVGNGPGGLHMMIVEVQ